MAANSIGMPKVIRIDWRNEGAGRLCGPSISSGRDTLIFRHHHLYAAIRSGVTARKRFGVVGRAVDDDENLERIMCLRAHAQEGSVNRSRCVVRWYDDSDRRA